jgi:hypothetical protein
VNEQQVLAAQREAFTNLMEHAQSDGAPGPLRQRASDISKSASSPLPVGFQGVKVLTNTYAFLTIVTGQALFNFVTENNVESFWVLFFVPADDSGTILSPPWGESTDGSATLYPSQASILLPPTSPTRAGHGIEPAKVFGFPAQCSLPVDAICPVMAAR